MRNTDLLMYYTQNQGTDDGMPKENLVFWHPLDALYQSTPSANTMVYAPEMTDARVTVVDGIPCVDFTGGYSTTYAMTSGELTRMATDDPVTLSIWLYATTPWRTSECFSIGRHPHSSRHFRYEDSGNRTQCAYFSCNSDTTTNSSSGNASRGAWHHLCGTVDAGYNVSMFIDGTLFSSVTPAESARRNGYSRYATIGCYGRSGQGSYLWFNGYLASARIYNRVLTLDEISLLATEHVPVTT